MVYLKMLPPEEQEKELFRLYKKVFSTQEGKIVLTSILEDLRFFTHPISEREEALRSYATHLLDYIVDGDTYDFVNAIIGIQNSSATDVSDEDKEL